MKSVVISPNPQHLQAVGSVLGAMGHATVLVDGGKTRMRAAVEQEEPDLVFVDGMCRDVEELALVEHVTAAHPRTVVILLCASPSPEFLLNAMRAGVREVLPSPAPAAAVEAAVGRVAAKLGARAGPARGKVVGFISCKGGSGSTFLATNLGWQLAESRNVLLVDLNLQSGDALSFVHDGRPQSTLADVARDIGRLDASLLAASTVKVSPTFSVLAAPDDLAQAMEVKPEHVDALLSVAATQYEFVLLDLPRNLDAVTIRALDRAQRVFAVLQSGLPSIRNANRLLDVFRSLGYPPEKTEMILNRFDRGAAIGPDQVRRSLGGPRLHTVPNAWREVSTSIDHGDPLARGGKGNAVTRQLAELAALIAPRQEDDSRGLLGRLFGRA